MKVEIEMPPDGTREWALVQLGLGKIVVREGHKTNYTAENLFGTLTGWRIYEDPLPVCRFCGHKPTVRMNIGECCQIECAYVPHLLVQADTVEAAKQRWREVNAK